MTNVEEQLQRSRATVLMTKAEDLHPHRSALFIRTESFEQIVAQSVDGMFRGIDYLVGKRTDARHSRSFSSNCR